jgi:hypothetical protein
MCCFAMRDSQRGGRGEVVMANCSSYSSSPPDWSISRALVGLAISRLDFCPCVAGRH